MNIQKTLSLLLAAVLLHATTQAAVLVEVDFDTGYSLGTLNGQSGSGDVGFAGSSSWTVNPATLANVNVISGGLNYSVVGGGTINGGSQALSYLNTTGSPATESNATYRSLSGVLTSSSEFYARVLVQQVSASPAGPYLFWWMNSTASGAHLDEPGFGLYNNQAGGRVTTGGTASAGALTGGVDLVVARFTK